MQTDEPCYGILYYNSKTFINTNSIEGNIYLVLFHKNESKSDIFNKHQFFQKNQIQIVTYDTLKH